MTRILSFLFGQLARIKKPQFLVQKTIRLFVKFYKIDLSKASKSEFVSLNDLFTRKIRKNFSAVSKESFIHPIEGALVTHGQVKEGQTFLIKGKNYSVKELIGLKESLEGYYFYNYYLSPQDYHRVHHPVSGKYISCREIKGPLYPVAPWFIKLMPSVFAKNYRTVSVVESSKHGTVYTIMVGALNVGSLNMLGGLFDDEKKQVKTGDELGIFEMGSSVVVFCKKEFNVKKHSDIFC